MGKGATDEEAQTSALAEAAERWSGTWQPADSAAFRASCYELEAEGVLAEPLNGREVKQPWLPARRLRDAAPVLLPAAHVLMGHPPVGGHVVRTDSNGLAAGSSLADATLQGLLELLERDAVARWWDGDPAGPWLQSDDERVAGVKDWMAWLGVDVEVLRLRGRANVPVVLALGRPSSSQRLLFGAGAHVDLHVAYRRAVFELGQTVVAARATAREISVHAGFRAPSRLTATSREESVPTMTPRPTHPVSGVLATVERIVASLAAEDIDVFMSEVTREEVGVPVVRVLAPRLSSLPTAIR